jgi:outer membrane protein
MRRIETIVIWGLLAMTFVVVPATTDAQELEGATLKDLVLQAIKTHEVVQVANSEIRRAQADVKLARSALMPRFEANGSYTFYDDDLSIELSPGESFVIRPMQDWTASIDLRQNLFTGLRAWRARDIAKLNRDIANLDRWTTINDLTLDVAQTFFDAVALAEWVEVRRTVVEENENQLKVAERLFEVGENSVADVARWKAQVAAAKQELTVAIGDASLALNRLERLAGLTGIDELKPPGPIPVPAGVKDDLVIEAFGQRPEMKTLYHQLEAAGLFVRLEKGHWYPQLEALGQYFQQKSGFPANDWVSLTLQLRVPIYDGGVTKANVAKAKEDLRQVELLDQTLRRTIEDQVDSAFIGYEAASAVYDAARERTEASRLAYRQVERAYRVGEASTTDLLNATTEAIDAETSQIVARAQREFQAIFLRYAVGMPPLPDLDFSQMNLADPQEN